MDDLDKQLAELQLITTGELKLNPNVDMKKVLKKIAPAVPPKPKKSQVYSNLPPIGVPKPYEKQAELPHSSYHHESNSTYANQDGLIYSNILHENKSKEIRNRLYADDLPPPPPLLMDELLEQQQQQPVSVSSQQQPANNSSSSSHQRQDNVNSYQLYDHYNQNTNFYKAQPQVPTNSAAAATFLKLQSGSVYSNIQQQPEYSNIDNISVATYENTRIHQKATGAQSTVKNTTAGTGTQFDSVLNYPGSSISDYENQTEGAFRSGSSASSSASRLGYDCDHILRSGSSASNYLPQHHSGNYDRFNDQSESIYAPLGRASDNDLPPPPPIMGGSDEDATHSPPILMCGESGNDLLTDEIPPPASPVSSSYSELRRATDLAPHHNHMYNPYNPPSHSSSTYESIYEPINPRPSSQNSTRSSGYSLYGQNSGKLSNSGTLTNNSKPSKELEVDKLTNLLVQGLGTTDEDDVYGICGKCNEKIVGEENGCSAMDNFYHIDCFRCCQCDINLQGNPFYALEGKPYCEQDYLNTLEKCSVCNKPILDRILRATGKPYHPKCFTCVVCNKSLDSVPFTVDATNQIHCIEDFNKKFAPRCCVCKLPIMPENGEEETVRVVALDRSFHIGCYKCEDCGLVLSSEAEGRGCYPLDGHVLCKNCNAIRVQELTKQMTTEL